MSLPVTSRLGNKGMYRIEWDPANDVIHNIVPVLDMSRRKVRRHPMAEKIVMWIEGSAQDV